jgi:shikimate dehydrogenase
LLDLELPEADAVISTLPAGAADTLSPQRWATRPVVLDVVYTPWPTPLAASAHSSGCRIVSGLAVLLHQAVVQVELMTGRRAPIDQMRAAMDAAALA